MQTQSATSAPKPKLDTFSLLLKNGLDDEVAEALQAYFPHEDPDGFVAGLIQIATMMNTKQPVGKTPKTQPFNHMYTEMMAAQQAGNSMDSGFNHALKAYQPMTQSILIEGISRMMQELLSRYQGVKSGSKMAPGHAQRITITNPWLVSPSPALQMDIETALNDKTLNNLLRKQKAETLLLEWLGNHGHFARAEGYLFYLYADTHHLFEMDTDQWGAWLHALTGLNPAGTDWGYMNAACKSAAMLIGEESKVVKLAHWDKDAGILRVSRLDGRVFALNGDSITEEMNGQGPALFKDLSFWEPVEPDFEDEAAFSQPFGTPAWEDRKWSWAAQVWLLSLFFTEMCPTRPIAVFLGEKGSGKSMTLRMYLRLLFGPMAELTGVPEKPDQLQVAAHHNHILAMDNFDGFNDWMRDKLASLATGVEDQARTLYTNSDMTRITYRCWVAVTARTPETLKRDDLADRLLILPLQRIQDGNRIREEAFLSKINCMRPQWWGGLLITLNRIVATLNAGGVPDIMSLRMADWESFGAMASRAAGKDTAWKDIVAALKKDQGGFLAADSIVVEAIDAWLANARGNINRQMKARELYYECAQALFPNTPPDSDWPRSVLSFSKRLTNVGEYLKSEYGMKTWEDRIRYTWYQFTKKP